MLIKNLQKKKLQCFIKLSYVQINKLIKKIFVLGHVTILIILHYYFIHKYYVLFFVPNYNDMTKLGKIKIQSSNIHNRLAYRVNSCHGNNREKLSYLADNCSPYHFCYLMMSFFLHYLENYCVFLSLSYKYRKLPNLERRECKNMMICYIYKRRRSFMTSPLTHFFTKKGRNIILMSRH